MITLKSEPQNKQKVLEISFAFYQQTFWIAFPYAISATFFIFMPQLLLGAFPFQSLLNSNYFLPLLGSLALCGISALMLLSGLIFRLYCACYQIPSNFFHSLKHASFKLIPLLLLITLYSLIILSGTMLLIFPGLILTVSLMFSFFLLITDNHTVLQTLILSHRLVWPEWRRSILIMSFALLFNIAFSLMAFLVVVGISGLFHSSITTLYWLTFIANILVQTLIIPLVFCTALVLLHDLRIRRSLLRMPW